MKCQPTRLIIASKILSSQFMYRNTTDQQRNITSVCRNTSAPFPRRNCNTSAFRDLAAQCRGVQPYGSRQYITFITVCSSGAENLPIWFGSLQTCQLTLQGFALSPLFHLSLLSAEQKHVPACQGYM